MRPPHPRRPRAKVDPRPHHRSALSRLYRAMLTLSIGAANDERTRQAMQTLFRVPPKRFFRAVGVSRFGRVAPTSRTAAVALRFLPIQGSEGPTTTDDYNGLGEHGIDDCQARAVSRAAKPGRN